MNASALFPWLRPYADRYHYLVLNQIEDLVRAGGYRQKFCGTVPTDSGGGGFEGSTGVYTREYYMNVKAGSYVYAVSVLGAIDRQWFPAGGAGSPGAAVGDCTVEVELIDSNTKEAWWRSSADLGSLGFWAFNDTMSIEDGNGVALVDAAGMMFNMWMQADRRLILGDGPQLCRFTQNFPAAEQSCFQLVLHYLEPIDEGVTRGI